MARGRSGGQPSRTGRMVLGATGGRPTVQPRHPFLPSAGPSLGRLLRAEREGRGIDDGSECQGTRGERRKTAARRRSSEWPSKRRGGRGLKGLKSKKRKKGSQISERRAALEKRASRSRRGWIERFREIGGWRQRRREGWRLDDWMKTGREVWDSGRRLWMPILELWRNRPAR